MKNKLFFYASYALIVVFAMLFLFFGNMIASRNMIIGTMPEEFRPIVERARVAQILDVLEDDVDFFWGGLLTKTILFEAELMSGDERGRIVRAWQAIPEEFFGIETPVEDGDRILITQQGDEWYFENHIRANYIIFLGAAFIALLLIFGRTKGLSTLLSLGFTCVAVFAVFIPAILSGMNIYLSAIIVCTFIVVITLFLLNGVNKKSIAAIIGCLGGVLAAGLLTLLMNNLMRLTGLTGQETIQLVWLTTENPIDLNALIFAGILIGAVGAIMDVALSLSSALHELKLNAKDMSFIQLYKSGITIGKDVIGATTNTLVLAYIGGSLTVILLMTTQTFSANELFNSQYVIVEFMQALIGTMGLILAMPLTALVCAALFTGKKVI